MLGFLFLIVGVWWMIRAFLERPINPLWWLGLISGILMTALAFWTSGQFFIHKAYVLLVFAGIWALMQGITNIVRAFQIRAPARGAVTAPAGWSEQMAISLQGTERLSRQQAAERLIDIAYALTAGGPLELIAAGRRITVPVDKRAASWSAS